MAWNDKSRAGYAGAAFFVLDEAGGEVCRPGDLVAFPLQAFAHQLAVPTQGFGPLAGASLRRLLVIPAQLHFAEDALALHFLLQRAQGLICSLVRGESSSSSVFEPYSSMIDEVESRQPGRAGLI